MAEKSGEFILRHKHPKAVEAAFRRKGSKEAKDVAERPKKSLSKEDREFLNAETGKALPAWLEKLESQLLTEDEEERTDRGIKTELFNRWAQKSGAITKEMSDSEYYRIVAGEHAPRSRETVLKELQNEQLATYGSWLNYLLAGEGRQQYEPWFRYLILSELTKRDDRGRRRDADTTSDALPFSANPIALVHDDLQKLVSQYHEHTSQTEYLSADRSHETAEEKTKRNELRKKSSKRKTDTLNALAEYPFHQKYLGYLADEQRAANEKLGYADGWHAFTDYRELAKISRGTPWCLAGLATAERYLSGKDASVRVYFKDGRPHIAIHIEDGEVHEVRGADDSQNLSAEYTEEVKNETAQYDNAEVWHKQAENVRKLGILTAKISENPAVILSQEELKFIYEDEEKIEGFGYGRDPRIEPILKSRNPREDAPIIFGCSPAEVAWSQEDLEKNPESYKAYIGPLFKGIYKLPLERIYTSFPEGKINFHRFSLLEIGDNDPDPAKRKKNLLKQLSDQERRGLFEIDKLARETLESEQFVVGTPKTVSLVAVSAPGLGFRRAASMLEIYDYAEKLGLQFVPAEIGPYLRMAYTQNPLPRDDGFDDDFLIAMQPIRNDKRKTGAQSSIFELGRKTTHTGSGWKTNPALQIADAVAVGNHDANQYYRNFVFAVSE